MGIEALWKHFAFAHPLLLLGSVGIDLNVLGGGHLPKCLKFCPGIEI